MSAGGGCKVAVSAGGGCKVAVSAGGGCKVAVTARTRCAWVKLRECGKLLYGKRFKLKLKRVDYKSYVRPEILRACREAWYMNETKIRNLRKE